MAKLQEVFELVRRNMEWVAQNQALQYEVTEVKFKGWRHAMGKGAPFVQGGGRIRRETSATIANMNFVLSVIVVLRRVGTEKEKNAHMSELKVQIEE